MIRVAALTPGRNVPSSRYRIRQFIEPLKRFGVQVSEHHPLVNMYLTRRAPPLGVLLRLPGLYAARRSEITWLGRELLAGRETLAAHAGARLLFDVDDALWLLPRPGASEALAGRCRGVIAGNQFIADHYRPYAKRVWLIPTSVDTERWRPAPPRAKARWTIGWIGTSSNLPYLASLEEPLAEFLARHRREAELLVVCDRRPALAKLPRDSYRFARWTEAGEVSLVQEMDVGLMPLAETEWARGKCGLKMLLYLSVGIPVIASPVGVNCHVLQQNVGLAATTGDEWSEALSQLYTEREMGFRLGRAGRRLVEEEYAVKKNVIALARVFGEVAGRELVERRPESPR